MLLIIFMYIYLFNSKIQDSKFVKMKQEDFRLLIAKNNHISSDK